MLQRARLKAADPTLIPRVLLVIGVFLCPVVIDPRAVKPFDLPKTTVIWAFAVLALGLWFIEVLQGRVKPVAFRLGLVAGAFLLACGIATIFSRTPIVSFFGWYGRYSGFTQFLLYVAVFWLIVQLYWRRPDRLRELVYALGAASSIAAAYIVIQWLDLDPFTWRKVEGGAPGAKYIGTLGNGNFAGGLLGATSPWLLFAFWRARRWWSKSLVVGWGAVSLWCLWLTTSRGGMVAMGAAAVTAAVAFRSRFPRWFLVSGAVVASVLTIATLAVLLRPIDTRPQIEFQGGKDVLRSASIDVRLVWWRSALSIFASRPLAGTGPDTFVVMYPQHMPEESAGVADVETADKPHNVLLDHLASMGILGFGSYAALVGLAALWGLRAMRTMDRKHGELLGTFLAFVAGYGGQAFFSIDMAPLALTGWMGLAGVAALADPSLVARRRTAALEAPVSPRPMTALRWMAVGAVALLTALLVVTGLRPLRADHAARAAQDAGRSGNVESARRHFDDALALFPFQPLYRGLAGDSLLKLSGRFEGDDREALVREAVTHFKKMDELQPHYHLWKMTIGEALGRLGEAGDESAFPEADVVFDDATALGPFDWRVPMRHGEMLNRWARAEGDRQRHCLALSKFETALSLRDDDARAWTGIGTTYAFLGQFDRSLSALERALVLDQDSRMALSVREQVLELRDRDIDVVRCR